MNKRSGPFWDGIEGRAPMPPAAATLGLEFIAADSERGTIELAFAAMEGFINPAGNVLGAFVAAMLYGTVGPALLATLEPDQFQSTLELNVNVLRPVRIRKGRWQGACRSPRWRHRVHRGGVDRFSGETHRDGHCHRSGHRARPRANRGVRPSG
jgi:acyl-coenzyme A thioesterase PaaI-like protein